MVRDKNWWQLVEKMGGGRTQISIDDVIPIQLLNVALEANHVIA